MSTPTPLISQAGFAILSTVKAYPWDLPLSAIGYEGIAFTPPDNMPWAYITLLPVKTESRGQTIDKDTTILQLDLNGPMNQGTADLYQRSSALYNYYLPRRLFSFTNAAGLTQKVKVTKRDRSPWRTYGGWEVINLSITFVAVVPRAFS